MGLRLWRVLGLVGAVMLAAGGAACAGGLPDHPLSLDECIALARQYNPSLTVARENVVISEAGVRRVLSQYYPTAALDVIRGRTGGTSFVDTAAGPIPFAISVTRRESDVSLNYLVWQTGRGHSLERARRELSASVAQQDTTAQDLILSVSQRYYAALAQEGLVEVAALTLQAARQHEELVRARASVGESPPIDVIPAEADTAAAEYGMIQAENAAAVAKASLKREIGLPATYELRLEPASLAETEEPLPTLGQALSIALARRPEARALRERTEAAAADVRLAEAYQRGAFTVSTEYVRGISGPREGVSWAAVASVTAYLFDGGARRADVESARAALRSLEAQQQDLANAIGLQVESALLDVETARKSLEAAEKAVASAEAQLAAAEGKYREGVGIFVEILDAQRAAARARTDRVSAVYDYHAALLALRKAMGVLGPLPSDERSP